MKEGSKGHQEHERSLRLCGEKRVKIVTGDDENWRTVMSLEDATSSPD